MEKSSQSTIKMDKGYYVNGKILACSKVSTSQSTIKMDKGYYANVFTVPFLTPLAVAIHNKNGQGLLRHVRYTEYPNAQKSQSTIKMDKGYYVMNL